MGTTTFTLKYNRLQDATQLAKMILGVTWLQHTALPKRSREISSAYKGRANTSGEGSAWRAVYSCIIYQQAHIILLVQLDTLPTFRHRQSLSAGSTESAVSPARSAYRAERGSFPKQQFAVSHNVCQIAPAVSVERSACSCFPSSLTLCCVVGIAFQYLPVVFFLTSGLNNTRPLLNCLQPL